MFRDVLILNVASDALLALTYFSSALLLVYFVRRRPEVPFGRVAVWLLGAFVVASGSMHLLAIWHPNDPLEGAVRALAAAASIATLVMLLPLLPKALALRSPAELDRLTSELAQALRSLARERHVARTFQAASLATELPQVDGLRFTAVYEGPIGDLEVGGDWYDAFTLSDGRVALTVGDVAGSGLEAAIVMTKVRQSLRAAGALHIDPGAILNAADRALRTEYPDRCVAAFVGIVDPIESTFSFAGAGHPSPLLRRGDGTIEELRSVSLSLGLRARGVPKAQTVPLAPGDVLVVYTDGLIKATSNLIEGESRLWEAVRTLDPRAANPARTVRDAVVSADLRDDVALLVMNYVDRTSDATDRWKFASDDAVAAGAARGTFAARLAAMGATTPDVTAAELVFSELIGNVYRYAPGMLDVVLDRGTASPVLHVLDRGDGFMHAARLPNDLLAERGRGLFMVASLTQDFHITHRAGGGSHARVVLSVQLPGVPLSEAESSASGTPA